MTTASAFLLDRFARRLLDATQRSPMTVDGGQVLFADDGAALAFEAFARRVRALALRLQQAVAACPTPAASPTVALHAPAPAEFAVGLWSAWLCGSKVILPPDGGAASCAALARHCAPTLWLGEFAATPAPALALREIIDDIPDAAQEDASAALRLPHAGHSVLTLFTSGSTGAPAMIDKCWRQLASEIDVLETTFALPAQARIWATVGAQHIYGLLFHQLWPLAGGRVCCGPILRWPSQLAGPGEAGHSADEVLIASPAVLAGLQTLEAPAAAPRRWHTVFSSGGPLERAASLHAQALLDAPAYEVYGSSETGGIAWRRQQAVGESGAQPASDACWTLFDGVRAWAEEVEAQSVLAVASARLPDAAPWITSDRVEFDDETRFRLRGRIDRVAKIAEKRISLTRVEQALERCADVTAARCLTLPSPHGGTRVAAVLIPSAQGWAALLAEGRHAVYRRLRAALRDEIEVAALPRRLRVVSAWPRNLTGKTPQALLERLFERPERELPLLQDCVWQNGEATPTPRVELRLGMAPDITWFDGHFPDAPIVPGVAQLDWVAHYGRQFFEFDAPFAGMEQIKFQQVIRPRETVRLGLEWRAATGTLSFTFDSGDGAGRHASGRLRFLAGPGDAA